MITFLSLAVLAASLVTVLWCWKLEEDARFDREERSRKRDRWWDY